METCTWLSLFGSHQHMPPPVLQWIGGELVVIGDRGGHCDASTQTAAGSLGFADFTGTSSPHDNDDFIIVSELGSAPPSQPSISSQPLSCVADPLSCASSTRGLASTLPGPVLPLRNQ
eukprot:4825564-Amphidinium_carterae.1